MMQSYKGISKLLLQLLGFLVVFYMIAYPCLRVSRILIARNYFVYKTIEEGGQLIEDHFDIDHGPAMVYGRIQQRTFLGVMYKPLSLIEVYLRGYGNYPRVWIAEEFICDQ